MCSSDLKFLVWTDNEGSPEDAVTREQILTNLSVYWFTRTINSSIRLYCESQRAGLFGPSSDVVTVPTAAAIFPKEIFRIPRPYAETRFNVVRYTRFGGESCESVVSDIATHVCTHAVYHRGQIAAQAARAGLKCPPTDFIVFSRL